MKIREWPTEVEAIDIQLRTLLERRAQLLRLASAPDDAPRPATKAKMHAGPRWRARQTAPGEAECPHPEVASRPRRFAVRERSAISGQPLGLRRQGRRLHEARAPFLEADR